MKTHAASQEGHQLPLPLTKHARARMQQRRLSDHMIAMVMTYGRLARVRGAEIFAIGKREVEQYLTEDVDLSKYQGVQVVCDPEGAILTAYRNSDFRGLRQQSRRRHHRCAA